MTSCRRSGGLLALSLALPAVASCGWSPRNPAATGPGPAVFERAPYLQWVDTSAATVMWRLRAPVADVLRYRVAGAASWTEARPAGSAPVVAGPAASGDSSGSPEALQRSVRLSGLPAGEAVEYVVRVGGTEFGPSTFRTAPGEGGGPVRVLAFGDSGSGSGSQLALARVMENREWDLAIHMGDLAYFHGSEEDFTLRHFSVYRPLLARIPLFPIPGDHDLRTAGGVPYDRAFRWPAPGPDARYYTFRWGDVQFVALDTSDESEDGRGLRRDPDSRQLAWLATTLDSLSRVPELRWTIVFMHAPPYSHGAGFGGHGSDPALRRRLPPLFDRYGVDLVLGGHDHHYERSVPIRDGEPVPPGCGPVYVVTGGGGAPTFGRSVSSSPLVARISLRHHFVGLSITADDMEGAAVDTRGEDLDRFRVTPYGGTEGDRLEERCD